MASLDARTIKKAASALGSNQPYFTEHLSREEALARVEVRRTSADDNRSWKLMELKVWHGCFVSSGARRMFRGKF